MTNTPDTSKPSRLSAQELFARTLQIFDAKIAGHSPVTALAAISIVAATGCGTIIDTALTGYPVSQSQEDVEKFAKEKYGQIPLEKITIRGLDYEFIGTSDDTQKVTEVKTIIEQTTSRIPVNPAPDVKTVIIVFNKSDTQTSDDSAAITPTTRTNGVQYIILNDDFSPEAVAHELVHGVYQTVWSKNATDFIGEGTAYQIADPTPNDRMPSVSPSYLLSLQGIFREDGNLSKGLISSDTEYLQLNTLKAFWNELETLDPGITYRLLQLETYGARQPQLKDLPSIIIANASAERKTAVTEFLKGCGIFNPTQNRNLLVIPDLSEDGMHPQVMVYYFKKIQTKLDSEIPYWYKSEVDGKPLSDSGQDPRHIKSNEPVDFTKYELSDGFSFTWTMEDPSSKTKTALSFKYEDGVWTQKH